MIKFIVKGSLFAVATMCSAAIFLSAIAINNGYTLTVKKGGSDHAAD